MNHRIRVAAIIIKDESILLVKHVHPETKYKWWVPPGGGVEEKDNNIFEAVKREVGEETGLNVKVKENIEYIREFVDQENNTLNLEIFIEAAVINGELTIDNIYGKGRDEDFIKSVKWVSKEEVEDLEIFPEIIKEKSFWEKNERQSTRYLGRQNG